jgi:hypothetical protein
LERNPSGRLLLGAGLLMLGMCGRAPAQAISPDTPRVRHLEMGATYVRESRDLAWHIRVTDRVPTPPGLYVVVYDEKGDILKHGEIPAGPYSPEAPFAMEIPADGLAQQYVIKLLGSYQNFSAVRLPMTDLPFEVYEGSRGGTTFGVPYGAGRETRRLAFQVKPGTQKVALTGGVNNMRFLDSQGVAIADNRADGALTMSPKPGQTYWLDPGNARQVQTTKESAKIFLALDPERWFCPTVTWDLESRPWWKGLFRE